MIIKHMKLICKMNEWVLTTDDSRAKYIEVTYKGKKVNCRAIVMWGKLP